MSTTFPIPINEPRTIIYSGKLIYNFIIINPLLIQHPTYGVDKKSNL